MHGSWGDFRWGALPGRPEPNAFAAAADGELTGSSPIRGIRTMPTNVTEFQTLDTVLDELDVQSQHRPKENDDDYWVCKRKHPRHPFRSGCTVRFMPSGSGTVVAMPGRTRNLSRNGLGVLVRRVFGPQEPIEVEVTLPDRPRMFMGGLVRFCRYAGRGYYELGVELKAAASEPIFSSNPILAFRALDWLNPETRTR